MVNPLRPAKLRPRALAAPASSLRPPRGASLTASCVMVNPLRPAKLRPRALAAPDARRPRRRCRGLLGLRDSSSGDCPGRAPLALVAVLVVGDQAHREHRDPGDDVER